MNLGESIRSLRKAKGFKLRDFAKRCGLSVTSLSNIERNRSFPTKPTIEAIADALGISIGLLLFNCLSEEDIPVEKRETFKYLVEPIKKLLS